MYFDIIIICGIEIPKYVCADTHVNEYKGGIETV